MRGVTMESRVAEYEARGPKCPRWAIPADKEIRLDFKQVYK